MARILIIEDNAENLELMRYLLSAFGHEVKTATDGRSGLDVANREQPDLIVCDVHMPGLDGYEVVRRIKGSTTLHATPVIAVTALAMVGDRERGLAAGFDDYLYKPIDPETFVSDLERYLLPESHGTAPKPAQAEPSGHAVSRPANRGKILVVDDSAANHELMRGLLAPFGYDVRISDNVADGLAKAVADVPDLIVSDLHMPDEDGFALIRQVKAKPNLSAIPVVVLSSTSWGERDRQIAVELGAAHFFLRPIEPMQLLDAIAACLAGRPGR